MTYLDDLEKLAELRDKGIISKEAFEQKKNAVLSQNSDGKTHAEQEQKSPNVTVRTVVALLLVVGAFAAIKGYKEITKRHQANQILDYVSRCAVVAQVSGDGYIIGEVTKTEDGILVSDTNCRNIMPLENAPLNLSSDRFIVYAAQKEDSFFKIETPPIPLSEVRQLLLNRNNRYVEIRKSNNGGLEFKFQK